MKLFVTVAAMMVFASASLAQNALPPDQQKQLARDMVGGHNRQVVPPATGKVPNRLPQTSAPKPLRRR
ncbi:hypothetical protein [Bradyrhizobium sp. WSM1743]|uniref:hypothetical protein n=1 Tax=Bradyrhizobium sp. WSM1743 TaxID=318996 RepID=UPI0012EB6CE8|nr:hypothetical protein [Bradyrhizobium sp. WSM1743]